MCQSQMLDIISELNECFSISDSDSVWGCKLGKVKMCKVLENGDLYCDTRQLTDKTKPTREHFENKIKERKSCLVELINFIPMDKQIIINLNKTLSYCFGLQNVAKFEENYGSNDMYDGKVIELKKIFLNEPINLTELRIQIVYDVLFHLIPYCGGTVISDEDKGSGLKPDVKLLISSKSTLNSDDMVVLVGSVIGGKNCSKLTSITPEQYFKQRLEEIQSMCEHKLESNSSIENTNDLVQATISFDMFQSNITKQVILHLEMDDLDKKTSCKGSLFVLYNYARLVNLLSKFNELVKSLRYPPLPDIDDTDFSLLTLQDEWKLMFTYILCWPNLIKQSIENIENGRPKLHQIFMFLMSLSTHFSVYYHRTRILTEPKSHLVPIVHARIRLLMGISQIYRNAFKIINLKPLNHM